MEKRHLLAFILALDEICFLMREEFTCLIRAMSFDLKCWSMLPCPILYIVFYLKIPNSQSFNLSKLHFSNKCTRYIAEISEIKDII